MGCGEHSELIRIAGGCQGMCARQQGSPMGDGEHGQAGRRCEQGAVSRCALWSAGRKGF